MSAGIHLVAVGDLSFNGGYARLRHNPLRRMIARWAEADLRIGNLESPLTDAPRARRGKLTLRGCKRATEFLREAGFAALCLANNHAMDYGPRGLAEMREGLEAAGLACHGAGPDEAAARAPLVLTCRGQRIGLLSYCSVSQSSPLYADGDKPGVALLDVDRGVEEVRRLRSQVDWLIVQAHWGEELCQLPTASQRHAARRLVEAGADLILGHHPHVWQPLEWIEGVPVFYSLGNCLFSEMFWRGYNAAGESFAARFRLHRRSRKTGWAEVFLRPGRTSVARFRPACLRRNLQLCPQETLERVAKWEALCLRLRQPDYNSVVEREQEQARRRRAWQEGWTSLSRRLALFLFDRGLLPGAVEGT
jgi:poly-gamma-glutamate synthesis protein (capsule biosynthesis protein)